MKFLSVCISKLRKLVSREIPDNMDSTEVYSLKCEVRRLELALQAKETDLAQAKHTIDVQNFEFEALQAHGIREVPVWVMAPEVYKKFCASFEPPIVNGQSSDHEAAYKLGIQRVLSRIGEQHVSR